MGFYFRPKPKGVPKYFVKATKTSLNMSANWDFIRALAGTSSSDSRVGYIFLDYRVQERIYRWAKRKGKATEKELKRIFQYPRGRRALRGIIRHEPGHADHYHIRFKCPAGQRGC